MLVFLALMEQEKIEQKLTDLSVFEGLQHEDLAYVYRGMFTQAITDSIIALTENNLDTSGGSSKLKKRVFSIMVECLQNVTRHQYVDDQQELSADKTSLFMVFEKDKTYHMTSGNVVNNENVPHLEQLLDKVNSLDKEELKDYFKQVLEEGSISSKGGAGLGLIDMARKSGNKLYYTFENIDDESSFFYMNTSISQQLDDSPAESVNIHDMVALHKFVLEKNIMLIFNGGLTQRSMMEILSLINEQSFGKLGRKKKMCHVMVEMLQNVVKHGVKRNESRSGGNPVLFYIAQDGDYFKLNAGNYIDNHSIEKVRSKIDLLNSLREDELEDFYTKYLLNFEIDNSKEAGLGLVDLRMKGGHKIVYKITPINERMSFIVMQVTI